MNKTLLLIYLGSVLCAGTLAAQSYGATFGLRLGNDPDSRSIGLSAQYRLAKTVTVEGILQSNFQHENFMAHLIIERHKRIISRRINFYVGGGFSIGNETSISVDPETRQEIRTHGNPTLGTDLILGAETTMLGYNFSLDYKPNINFTGREQWYVSQVGISARQVVIKSNAQKKHKRKRARAKKRKQRERDDEPWLREWYDKTFKGKG